MNELTKIEDRLIELGSLFMLTTSMPTILVCEIRYRIIVVGITSMQDRLGDLRKLYVVRATERYSWSSCSVGRHFRP